LIKVVKVANIQNEQEKKKPIIISIVLT